MHLPFDFNITDAVLMGILALLTLRGALRGFLTEVSGLLGIFGGLFVAAEYHGTLAHYLNNIVPEEWIRAVSFIAILCFCMFCASLAAKFLRSFLKMASAGWIDHILGMGIGFLKGLCLCCVLLYLVNILPVGSSLMNQSAVAAFIRDLSAWILQQFPDGWLAPGSAI
ncbi:MAG: CvpA family protein [Desulfovibrionaceae bacterium]|nr:CvpA family protein [Desulfovibrionaceae bacterium]